MFKTFTSQFHPWAYFSNYNLFSHWKYCHLSISILINHLLLWTQDFQIPSLPFLWQILQWRLISSSLVFLNNNYMTETTRLPVSQSTCINWPCSIKSQMIFWLAVNTIESWISSILCIKKGLSSVFTTKVKNNCPKYPILRVCFLGPLSVHCTVSFKVQKI